MYSPVKVASTAYLKIPPEEVGAQLLKLENWKDFSGYGPLPGIKEACFRKQTPEVVGTQIEVSNKDGSKHVEEITEWLPTGITLRFSEFSAPVVHFASHFIERWTFTKEGDGYRVLRSFELYPKSLAGALVLRLIGPLMRRATDRHLEQMGKSV